MRANAACNSIENMARTGGGVTFSLTLDDVPYYINEGLRFARLYCPEDKDYTASLAELLMVCDEVIIHLYRKEIT